MLRYDGRGHKRPKECEDWAWEICGARSDIIAYRPILSEPEAPEWDGPQHGLPPIGTVCEVADMVGNGRRVLIVGHDTQLKRAIYRSVDWSDLEYDSGLAGSFRPIRSEEDRAVEEMLAVIEEAESADGCCRALYRAGYRKTGGE